MISRRILCAFVSCFALARMHAQPALGNGESLTYRVGWGIFVGAGEIKIVGQSIVSPEGKPELKAITTTATRGLGRALYLFEASAESIFDLKTGQLLTMAEHSKTSRKDTNSSVKFDYAKSIANYVNTINPERTAALPMPPGEPSDLIMSLVQTREWNLKPGEQRDALVLFDNDFYELTIHALGYEDVHTSLGSFHTLMLEPRMEKTPPKGMFKRGSGVRVWISQDAQRLPVKFQVEFKFGAGVATLVDYQPPTKPAAPSPAPPDAKDPRP
jgi:hypothetical protein